MALRRVFQLMPNAPGTICGIADYAMRLSEIWRQQSLCESVFLHLNPALEQNTGSSQVIYIRERDAAAFGAVFPKLQAGDALLLHYEAYGYAANGDPRWFGPALAALLSRQPQLHVVVFFHELFAVSPPWRRAFYLTGKQQATVRQIAARAKAIVTSNAAYAAWLSRERFWVDQVLAVPSNVGEPLSPLPWQERSKVAVVFGGAAMRARLYKGHGKYLHALLRQLDVEQLIDIGPPIRLPRRLQVHVTECGVLATDQVSKRLQQARFGLIAAKENELAKSGIFAAYSAHALTPIVFSKGGQAADGLQAGREYWPVKRGRLLMQASSSEQLASAVRRWYAAHAAAVHAAALLRLLLKS